MDSDLDSMPELGDAMPIPVPAWLIPRGVTVRYFGRHLFFAENIGQPWEEVLEV